MGWTNPLNLSGAAPRHPDTVTADDREAAAGWEEADRQDLLDGESPRARRERLAVLHDELRAERDLYPRAARTVTAELQPRRQDVPA